MCSQKTMAPTAGSNAHKLFYTAKPQFASAIVKRRDLIVNMCNLAQTGFSEKASKLD